MLQFHLDNAEKIAQLEHLQKIAERGTDIPFLRAWADRPRPTASSYWAWRAWEVLNTRRFVFDGVPQPLQLTEIFAYANEAGITSAPLREDLMYSTVTLDIIWREHMAKKRGERQAAERRKQEQEARKGRRR